MIDLLLFVSALSIVVLLIEERSEDELELCAFPMDEKLRSSNMSTELAWTESCSSLSSVMCFSIMGISLWASLSFWRPRFKHEVKKTYTFMIRSKNSQSSLSSSERPPVLFCAR